MSRLVDLALEPSEGTLDWFTLTDLNSYLDTKFSRDAVCFFRFVFVGREKKGRMRTWEILFIKYVTRKEWILWRERFRYGVYDSDTVVSAIERRVPKQVSPFLSGITRRFWFSTSQTQGSCRNPTKPIRRIYLALASIGMIDWFFKMRLRIWCLLLS